MKRKIVKILAIILVFSVFLISTQVSAIEEFRPSDEKLSNVETNCDTIRESLKRIQNADRNTRISLGRTYQTLLSSFITPLNVRLIKNNYFDSELADIQTAFSNDREIFNHAYIDYSKEFENLLSIDCKSDPNGFYNQLEKTREARKTTSEAALTLHSTLSDHVEAVENFKDSLKKERK